MKRSPKHKTDSEQKREKKERKPLSPKFFFIAGALSIMVGLVAHYFPVDFKNSVLIVNSDKAVTYTEAKKDKFVKTVESAEFYGTGDSYRVVFALDDDSTADTTIPQFSYKDYFDALEKAGADVTVASPATMTPGTVVNNDGEEGSANYVQGESAAVQISRPGDTLNPFLVFFYNLAKGVGVPLGIMLLIFGGFRYFKYKREIAMGVRDAGDMSGMGGPFAQPKGSQWLVEQPTTTFADVAGQDEAVTDLQEMVEYMTDPERFMRLGAKPPKGALLVGPPGTGKTLLARAVAGEAGVPFYSVSGSDFIEKFVGVGAQRIRALFADARKHEGGAIIFIDEIDAIGRTRDTTGMGGNQEGENTLISLMTELDGFESRGNVIVLAATNRPDILDSAVTRPGRLDRKVQVSNPDRLGREKILGVHAQGKPIDELVDMTAIARRTPGMSGADMEAIVNEACMVAARRDLDSVDVECFDDAIATIVMGRARTSALIPEHDRINTAWHETGHALAAFLLPDADDPVQVTIVPRGHALGLTWMSGNDEVSLTRAQAHARLVVAMAGRAGEEFYMGGEFTSGASGDIKSATSLATHMASEWGMTRLGMQLRDPKSKEVQEVVAELMDEALDRARSLVMENGAFFTAMVETLLDEENLTHAQIAALFEVHSPVLPEKAKAIPILPQSLIEERRRKEQEQEQRDTANAEALAAAAQAAAAAKEAQKDRPLRAVKDALKDFGGRVNSGVKPTDPNGVTE